MNLNMITPKNETEELLLFFTKNCETLIHQTHTKLQQTREYKIFESRETFHLNSTIQIKEDWMIGLTSLEVYNSILLQQEKTTNSNFIIFLIQRLVVGQMKKSEMRLKKTWTFQILQMLVYKMK